MTLPAHRFRDREERKKKHKGKVGVFDFDGTISGTPDFISRIAHGLKKQGDTIVVLTGNTMARQDLLQTLDDYGFPYDEVIQYHDDDSNGVSRAEYLKKLGADYAFDNRVDRAVLFAPICPTLYLVVEPTKDDEQAAQKADAKKTAKQAAKKVGLRSAPMPPPNYRPDEEPGESCGTCLMNNGGYCWGYGNVHIASDHVCDSWEADDDSQSVARTALVRETYERDGLEGVLQLRLEGRVAINDVRRAFGFDVLATDTAQRLRLVDE